MGLYNGNLTNYYNGTEPPLGAYQFISITDIINNFMVIYVGEDKIIPNVSRADVRFHASRAIQELTYDTFRSCKNLQMEVPPSLKLPLPHDYVNYVRLTVSDGENDENCKTLLHCKACPRDPLTLEKLLEDHEDDDVVYGCTDPEACNYDPLAEVNDFSCYYPPIGTDCDGNCLEGYVNVNGVCVPEVIGCMDDTALNFNILANVSCNGCCIAVVNGCTNPTSFNYNAFANTDDGSCVAVVDGCTDATAFNYNPAANTDDGSCIDVVNGCTDPLATNYNSSANTNDGSCVYPSTEIFGCTDPLACNYDPLATADDGSCIMPPPANLQSAAFGLGDPNQLSNGSEFSMGNGICAYPYQNNPSNVTWGAHMTNGFGAQGFHHTGGSGSTAYDFGDVYMESYYFDLGGTIPAGSSTPELLTIGQTYCLAWAEIVLRLEPDLGETGNNACSDCLNGGWTVKLESRPGTPIGLPAASDDDTDWGTVTNADVENAFMVYDPIVHNNLTTAQPGFHNSLCNTNDVGNSNGVNTAGASNGSYSQWRERCVTFTATETQHRLHLFATTDFSQCTGCHSRPESTGYGAYVGLSKVQINTGCTGDCNC